MRLVSASIRPDPNARARFPFSRRRADYRIHPALHEKLDLSRRFRMLARMSGGRTPQKESPMIQRLSELATRRTRRAKLVSLRKRYAAARTEDEKKRILAKMSRVHPLLSVEEFLAPLNRE
jgi:hypothetical protein